MLKYVESSHLILIVTWVLIFYIGLSGYAQAASLKLKIQNDRVYLRADQVSLISVLKAIAEKADIYLESGDPLTKPISLELNDVPIEDSVRRLLAKQNYTLIFKKIGDTRFLLTEIRILAPGTKEKTRPRVIPRRVARVDTATKLTAHPSPPPVEPTPQELDESPFRRYEKDWFKQELENIDLISDEITMETSERPLLPEGAPVPDGLSLTSMPKDPSQPGGMGIKEIVAFSVFAQIGLKDGDVVRDVNGQMVETKEEFIKALQKASEDRQMIRIERTHENGMMNPIYIELNSPDSPDTQPAP